MKEHFTNIEKIGLIKKSGSEWSVFSKTFYLEKAPHNAVIRIDSLGVCGIFLNGEFLEATTGRYSNRIACFECTSLLKLGENKIELKLGNHYYQTTLDAVYDRLETMLSCFCAELKIVLDGREEIISTNTEWDCISDDGQTKPYYFSTVTNAEYQRFWTSAAKWEEQKQIEIPKEVSAVAGEKYLDYVKNSYQKYKTVDNVIKSKSSAEETFVIYDLGKLYVGYLEIELFAENKAKIKAEFDYREVISDFDEVNGMSQKLAVWQDVKKGENKLLFIRRRAGRFIKLTLKKGITIKNVKMRLSTKPFNALGWFESEDELLNKAWQVGRYTLQVNRHQEYESCPRNEMKYFSGDAIVEALVDYYAFGDGSLVDASLSLTEIDSNSGFRRDKFQKNLGLWDYPAWRILTAYNHYKFFADEEFVKKYFDELAQNIDWMIEKMNENYLIYQFPCFSPPMYATNGPVEYNSSPDRLGEKPLLNALFYASLVYMSEFALIVGDKRANEWKDLAQKVKQAINENLWCEEKGAYLDLFNTNYIPQDGNAVALICNVADGEKIKRALETVKNECWTKYGSSMISTDKPLIRGQARVISPVMNTYEAEARFLYGKHEEAIELIRACWGEMIKKGAETFWEFAPNSEERWPIPAHGWASGCTYLLSAYVLGVRPEKAGYEEILFSPSNVLGEFCGVVPTKKGLIAVKFDKKAKKYTVAIPKGEKLSVQIKKDEQIEIIEY